MSLAATPHTYIFMWACEYHCKKKRKMLLLNVGEWSNKVYVLVKKGCELGHDSLRLLREDKIANPS